MKSCELYLLWCIVSQPTNLGQTNFNLRCDRFPSNRHCLLFWDFFLPLNCKQTNPSKISQKFLLQPWCLGILIWKTAAAVVTLNREAATLPKVLRSQLIDSLRKPNARNRQHLDLPEMRRYLENLNLHWCVHKQTVQNFPKIMIRHCQSTYEVSTKHLLHAPDYCGIVTPNPGWLVTHNTEADNHDHCSQLCSQNCLPLSRNPPSNHIFKAWCQHVFRRNNDCVWNKQA